MAFKRHENTLVLLCLAGLLLAGCGGTVQAMEQTSEAIRADASGVPFLETATARFIPTELLTPTIDLTASRTSSPSPTGTPTTALTNTPISENLDETETPLEEPPPSEGEEDWWQVIFTSPGDVTGSNDLTNRLVALLDGADTSIHMAVFRFNLGTVTEALINAQERGVQVQVITDDLFGLEQDVDEGNGQFAFLLESGIEVRGDTGEGLMNNKFVIVDGWFVWTGSTNLTVNGTFLNNNNVITIDSLDLAAIYEREFAEMWAGEFGVESPVTEEEQALSIGTSAVQVLFGPEDQLAASLIDLVSGASSSLRIMAFSFTHDELGAAVLERYEAGVDVQALFEARGSETEFSEMPAFFCAGLPVRQDGNPQTMNHKVIVIDELIVVTGSFNFSESANSINDENIILIVNPQIAALYLEEFDRLWEAGAEPAGETIACN